VGPRLPFPGFPFGMGASDSENDSDKEFSEKGKLTPIDLNLGLEAIGQFARRQIQR
jgi:hypothetical protein